MTDDVAAGPPGRSPALARLWEVNGGRGRTSPPARVGLSVQRVVQAALELADADGLEAVSMSRVADRLGFATMSLYRHVASKDDLLLLMHDTAWRAPDEPITDSGDRWRAGLTQWTSEQHQLLRAHPWLEQIRLGERAGTPSHLTWIDRGLQALTGTPLRERDKVELLLLLNGYVFWEARFYAEAVQTPVLPGVSGAPSPVGAAMRAVVDADRFPALRRSVDAGAFDEPPDRYADFVSGLDRILDGIASLVARRAASG
ncbi:TetR family transcriptional regulator [Actinomycetota bacterium]|nr:TetR family transcriptional regulator [Actinomycetota bacterium]